MVDEPLIQTRGGVTHFYYGDGLGSVKGLLNTAGEPARTQDYSAFGQIVKQTGAVYDRFGYTARGVRLVCW